MEKIKRSVVLVIILSLSACVKLKKVDLVVHNAKIYTVNSNMDIAQAMAIQDGEIVAVGKEHEIMNKYRADDFFDAQTQPIFPGFIDAHCHFIGYGLNQLATDVSGAKSIEGIAEQLQSINNDQKDSWIVGYGWNEKNWKDSVITNKVLNTAFPNTPVMLWRVDGHQLLVNHAALKQVFGDSIIATDGRVYDEHIPLFTEKINYTRSQLKQAIRLAQEACLKNGLTSVADAGITNEEWDILAQFERNGNLDVRVYAMLKPTPKNFKQAGKEGPYHGDYLHVNSFKFLADGSFGSSTALLTKPYQETANYGKELLSYEELLSYANSMKSLGFQMNVHCIGDSAFKNAIKAMREVLVNANDKRWRIEHAQLIDSTNINLLSAYSIIPSVQPSHGISDYGMAEGKIGKERLNQSYLIKTLLAQNKYIAFGTDFPVEPINPFRTFYHAIERNQADYLSKETITREQALKAMTIWAAKAQFEDKDKGTLEIGKKADFIVINRDIMTVSPEEILKTDVLFTFVNGYKMVGE